MKVFQTLAAAAITAAAVAPAGAATYRYDLKLTYLGTTYSELRGTIYGDDRNDIHVDEDLFLADGNSYGLPVLNPRLNPGDQTSFSAELYTPDGPDVWGNDYGNGGKAKWWILAGTQCNCTFEYVQADQENISMNSGDTKALTAGLVEGGTLSYMFNVSYRSQLSTEHGLFDFWNRTANFTIDEVSVRDVSSVPVPASGALLLGALGIFAARRRRNRA